MHEVGCSSQHVPPVPLSRDEDILPELGDKQRLLHFRSKILGTKSQPIDPSSLHGLRSGHGLRIMKRRTKHFALFVLRQCNRKELSIVH